MSEPLDPAMLAKNAEDYIPVFGAVVPLVSADDRARPLRCDASGRFIGVARCVSDIALQFRELLLGLALVAERDSTWIALRGPADSELFVDPHAIAEHSTPVVTEPEGTRIWFVRNREQHNGRFDERFHRLPIGSIIPLPPTPGFTWHRKPLDTEHSAHVFETSPVRIRESLSHVNY